MKMINAGTALITEYSNYQYNCILGKCQRKYYVPVPTLADVQLFVNFGPNKPETLTWTMIETCAYNSTAETEPDCFKIAFNGINWYGIFKGFTSAENFPLFSIALEVVYENTSTDTFFSEQYELPTMGCSPFTKISVCYPSNYNADDINGIFIGVEYGDYPVSGLINLFYQHQYWVRDAEVIEIQNQITFKANSTKNFASTLNKIFEFRPELVPGWYKDYLLAVYFRGNFMINNTPTKATDLAFENVLEEADLWKPYVKLDKELKGAFGCATTECEDLCEPCVPPALTKIALPEGFVGVPYTHSVTPAGGTAPFYLSAIVAPDWMTVEIVGNDIVFSGTPDEAGAVEVEFRLNNFCGFVDVEADGEISGEVPPEIITILGTVSYTCIPGSGGSQGLGRFTFNFPAPLPTAITFVFGGYSSGGTGTFVATVRRGYNCFIMPAAVSQFHPCGYQYTIPAGTTNIIINGNAFTNTNCGTGVDCGISTGWAWTCIDHLSGAPDLTSLYAKITTAGYASGITSADVGMAVVNQ